jgi:hypothetical protein
LYQSKERIWGFNAARGLISRDIAILFILGFYSEHVNPVYDTEYILETFAN